MADDAGGRTDWPGAGERLPGPIVAVVVLVAVVVITLMVALSSSGDGSARGAGGRSPGATGTGIRPSTAGARSQAGLGAGASPSGPAGSGDPILVGAGDIADQPAGPSGADESTAQVIDRIDQRFAPMTAAGVLDRAHGIRQFVAGTGGRGFYPFGNPGPNTEAWNVSTYGVLELTLHPTSYDFAFVPVAGSTWTDAGAGVPCH